MLTISIKKMVPGFKKKFTVYFEIISLGVNV